MGAVEPRPAWSRPAPLLVGREREQEILRDHLTAALAGRGSLVLIGGEAGIGKTALAEALCGEAVAQGALALVGRCYDLTETSPYGPWTEARAQFPPSPDLPLLPSALHTAAGSVGQFFAEVRGFFAAASARQPFTLFLDDLQWADPASLDLLRFLARSLASYPILLLIAYRPDDLTRHHPFSQLLPLLVRESHAERLALGPLPEAALRDLVRARYRLAARDEARLVAYLARRTEGNALFATELLRALEEQGAVDAGGGRLDALEAIAVPPLLRQVIDGRVMRLGEEAEGLLEIAAVIGQGVPLDTWAAVAQVDEGAIEQVVEWAFAAGLLTETGGEAGVGFAHALIREALYEGIPPIRRRRLHRQVAEALAAVREPAPDAVAYHFQRAGDARAATWLVEAGWRAYRSFAYETARTRFDEALPTITATERARALLALSTLDRYRQRGIRYAEEALASAQAAGDAILAAVAQFRLGITLSYHGRFRAALQAMKAADDVLDAVPDAMLPSFYGVPGLTLTREWRRECRVSVFAFCGQWREVFALFGETQEAMSVLSGLPEATGALAICNAYAFLGRPGDARRAIVRTRAVFVERQDTVGVLSTFMIEGCLVLVPYLLDDPDARQRYEQELAHAAWQLEEALGTVPPHFNHCPLLIAAGRWAEARALWAQRRADAPQIDRVWNIPHVGALARAQGERAEAWALVSEGLPDGLQTEPGTSHFIALNLQCLAARLCLDAGDRDGARQWLDAHNRWLDWAGVEARWGHADGQLAWAEYYRVTEERALALQHAEQALAHASDPHQPLALLAAHRLLGELDTEAGHFAAAVAHLDASLSLADACAAPYERALTLLALAELRATTSENDEAARLLTEVRSICEPLGAQPTLARVAALTERLATTPTALPAYPAGLSAREVEVLRLVAQGLSNPQVAARLFLSPRTVDHHLRSIYRKLGVSSRTAASRFAIERHLT